MKKKNKHKKTDSIKREIDRLIESADFEPVNFYEWTSRLRHLMCLL